MVSYVFRFEYDLHVDAEMTSEEIKDYTQNVAQLFRITLTSGFGAAWSKARCPLMPMAT